MKQLTICVRGVAQSEPGPAAIAVLVVDADGTEVLNVTEQIGNATSEYAEYYAIVRALQLLKEQCGDKTKDTECALSLGNETVRQQLNAEATITNPGLVPYFIEIYNARVENFPQLLLQSVAKSLNMQVDKMVREALDG